MAIVTYAHRVKRPRRRKAEAQPAAITRPVIVMAKRPGPGRPPAEQEADEKRKWRWGPVKR